MCPVCLSLPCSVAAQPPLTRLGVGSFQLLAPPRRSPRANLNCSQSFPSLSLWQPEKSALRHRDKMVNSKILCLSLRLRSIWSVCLLIIFPSIQNCDSPHGEATCPVGMDMRRNSFTSGDRGENFPRTLLLITMDHLPYHLGPGLEEHRSILLPISLEVCRA